MECAYVKENLLEVRNHILYPELVKLFKQLLSVKTISALRLQALRSDRKAYDDIDFSRIFMKGCSMVLIRRLPLLMNRWICS